ncbi:MAG: class I mannose-6-phosphate isomerase [Bacteroidales bacterium]|nr:class I mannose-6-phosphate isomerase [Bacteroidales bacterium]
MLYPLKFKLILKQTVWGGSLIASLKGIAPAEDKIGESWEISGCKGSESVVAEGPLAGKTMGWLLENCGDELVGKRIHEAYGNEFPLLLKFIDSNSDLSIQVHPDDTLALARHGCRGKSEMWYIIDAAPGASVISGFSKEISKEEYQKLVAENRLTDVLARHEARPGDVFFLPAGRVHAICSGCLLAEIQETSDITYRIFDYGRLGLDGKPRQLHVEESLDAVDFAVYPSYRTLYDKKEGETEIISTKWFTTSVIDIKAPLTKDLSGMDSFLTVMCLEGSGSIECGIPAFEGGPTKGHVTSIRRGESVLIPASALSAAFKPEDRLKLLISSI